MGIVLTVVLPLRGTDPAGSGHWGAPRGKRIHMGIDFAAPPGGLFISPVSGHVSKLGYPYADDLTYRYVQVTDAQGRDHRFFYLAPELRLGAKVIATVDVLGKVQDVSKRYPVPKGMKPHVHYGVRLEDGSYINPETL